MCYALRFMVISIPVYILQQCIVSGVLHVFNISKLIDVVYKQHMLHPGNVLTFHPQYACILVKISITG